MTENSEGGIDGAVAAIMALESPTADDPPKVEEPASEPETEEPSEPATTGDDASEDTDPGDGEEEVVEPEAEADPVDAPQWWDADAKSKFGALPADLKAVVAEQESKREAITAKVKAEATEARKAADVRADLLEKAAEAAIEAVERAQAMSQSRWRGADKDFWLELSRSNPSEYVQLRAEYDADRAELESLRVTSAQSESVAHRHYIETEQRKLTEQAPELVADPEAMRSLGEYLASNFEPERIANAGATELIIAHKAMLWDRAQATAKTKAQLPKTSPAPAKTVPANGARSGATSREGQVRALQNRLAQTRSMEDAVSLMLAKGL